MAHENRRSLSEGITAGIIAGIVFATMEIVGAVMMGNPALMPVRMFASVVLGQEAMQGPLGTALVVGTIAHLALSAIFGIVYGLFAARASEATRTSFGRQAGLGVLFGLAVWLVNFQIVARVLYPWFLGTPQFLQAMMHGLFFGLPLALVYAGAERRAHVHVPAARTV
jgi:phage shock protein PspC (stress-responsive transcriptional regulator)